MSRNKVLKFTSSTDYSALKGFPQTININLSIPGGNTIGAGSYLSHESIVTPTSFSIPKGAPLQTTIAHSLNSNFRFQTSVLQFVENTGLSNQYQGLIFVYSPGENQIAVRVSMFNGTGSGVTTIAQTVNVTVRSFIPPFS